MSLYSKKSSIRTKSESDCGNLECQSKQEGQAMKIKILEQQLEDAVKGKIQLKARINDLELELEECKDLIDRFKEENSQLRLTCANYKYTKDCPSLSRSESSKNMSIRNNQDSTNVSRKVSILEDTDSPIKKQSESNHVEQINRKLNQLINLSNNGISNDKVHKQRLDKIMEDKARLERELLLCREEKQEMLEQNIGLKTKIEACRVLLEQIEKTGINNSFLKNVNLPRTLIRCLKGKDTKEAISLTASVQNSSGMYSFQQSSEDLQSMNSNEQLDPVLLEPLQETLDQIFNMVQDTNKKVHREKQKLVIKGIKGGMKLDEYKSKFAANRTFSPNSCKVKESKSNLNSPGFQN